MDDLWAAVVDQMGGYPEETSERTETEGEQEQITKLSNELAWFIPLVATDSVFYVSADVENVVASVLNPNPMPIGPSAEYAWHPAR